MKLEPGSNYLDDLNLKKRKGIYDYVVPKIDLEEEIIGLIDNKSSVLDVGCGNGDLLIRMRGQGFSNKLIGIDLSEGMIEAAVQQSIKESLDIVFEVGNAKSLRFSDASFDVIVSKHVLYHVGNVEIVVKEAHRCLKPGGLFIVALNIQSENKPKLVKFYKEIDEEFNLRVNHAQNILSIENFASFLSEFSEKKLLRFENAIKLKDSRPYIDYLNSHRDFFKPYPDNKQWDSILKKFKNIVEEEINERGEFEDKNAFGIFIAAK